MRTWEVITSGPAPIIPNWRSGCGRTRRRSSSIHIPSWVGIQFTLSIFWGCRSAPALSDYQVTGFNPLAHVKTSSNFQLSGPMTLTVRGNGSNSGPAPTLTICCQESPNASTGRPVPVNFSTEKHPGNTEELGPIRGEDVDLIVKTTLDAVGKQASTLLGGGLGSGSVKGLSRLGKSTGQKVAGEAGGAAGASGAANSSAAGAAAAAGALAEKGLSKLPRFQGPKPSYHVNPAHVPGAGLRQGKTPLPRDAGSVYKKAVPNDPVSPTAWFGRNSEGQIYRFSLGNDGTAHFSGIKDVGSGTRNITQYAIDRLNGL